MKQMAFISRRGYPGIFKGEDGTMTLKECIKYVQEHQGERLLVHYLQARD